MRVAPDSQWRPFTAEQVISVDRPGFAWLARVQVMPRLSAHVLDCYVDGEGLLEARLCGSVPLARAAGLEVSKGELMRYLAELIWAPHAMRITRLCPRAKSTRRRSKCPRELQTVRRGCGWFSRMVISFAWKPTTARVRQEAASSRRAGGRAAATTEKRKAAAFPPGRR
jgi:uncharacterized protein DUF6920